jgi:hypothetical protein
MRVLIGRCLGSAPAFPSNVVGDSMFYLGVTHESS